MDHIKNINKLMLNEVFDLINNDITLLDKGRPFAYQPGSILSRIFNHGFLQSWKFHLPCGIPPYSPYNIVTGVGGFDLLVAIRRGRFDYFMDDNIPAPRREKLFIELLEGLSPNEAKIVLAIKDQNITSLYPNINYTNLAKYGYLPHNKQREQDEAANSKSEQSTVEVSANETSEGTKRTRTRRKAG